MSVEILLHLLNLWKRPILNQSIVCVSSEHLARRLWVTDVWIKKKNLFTIFRLVSRNYFISVRLPRKYLISHFYDNSFFQISIFFVVQCHELKQTNDQLSAKYSRTAGERRGVGRVQMMVLKLPIDYVYMRNSFWCAFYSTVVFSFLLKM